MSPGSTVAAPRSITWSAVIPAAGPTRSIRSPRISTPPFAERRAAAAVDDLRGLHEHRAPAGACALLPGPRARALTTRRPRHITSRRPPPCLRLDTCSPMDGHTTHEHADRPGRAAGPTSAQ